MCGIIGYLDKRGDSECPVGSILLGMLQALSCRGPDSVGVALFGSRAPTWLLHVPWQPLDPELGRSPTRLQELLDRFSAVMQIEAHSVLGDYLSLDVAAEEDPVRFEERLHRAVPGAEIVSLGRQLEIIKQVGSPEQLEGTYQISRVLGSHGLGHTRLSTESRVDLSHSQPFWAHGVPDLATVHNGHITNYHKLRRRFEQRGYRFYTENDSEIIGVYLRDRLAAGLPLADALRASLDDFDGSFSYLAASGDCLAYVKDRFGFKPLIVAETDEFVAVATEEIALRRALGRDFVAREPAPGTMRMWTVPSYEGVRT
jgi:glutamate synthase domain-containing protein 1